MVGHCLVVFFPDRLSLRNKETSKQTNEKPPLKSILEWKVLGTDVTQWNPGFSLNLSPSHSVVGNQFCHQKTL